MYEQQQQQGFGQPQAFGQPQGQPQGFGPAPGGAGQPPSDNERMWAMIAHLGQFLVGFWGPLVLMFVDIGGQPSPFIKHHAKQSLIWGVAMVVASIFTCGIAALPMLVFLVLAGLAANKGEWYVYPGLGRFV